MQKKMIFVLFLLGSFIQPSSAGTLKNNFDRFSQKPELKWISDVKSSDPQSMGVSASIFFSDTATPLRALVHVAGSFDRLEYARCHSMYWLADGEPVKPSAVTYQTVPRRDSPSSVEIVTSVVSIEQFKQMAAAKTLEYRVCRDEGIAPADDVDGLRQMVDKLAE